MNSVAVLPMPPTSPATAPAAVSVRPDERLLSLGQAFEAAWAHENSCYRDLDQVADEDELVRLRNIIRYREGDAVDARLMRYLGMGELESSLILFSEPDMRDLRDVVGKFGAQADARISELEAAYAAMKIREQQVGLVAFEQRATEANEKTAEIVHEIENLPARSLAEVLVKVRAVRWCRTNDIEDDVSDEATDMRLLQRILEDLDQMAHS